MGAQEGVAEALAGKREGHGGALPDADRLAAGDASFDEHEFKTLQENAPRGLGIGTYRFRESRNSI